MSTSPAGRISSRPALFVQLLIEVPAMEASSISCVVSGFVVPSASIRCNRSSSSSCSTTSCSLSSSPRRQRLVSLSSSTSSSPALSSLRQAARPTSLCCCQASSGDVPAATEKFKSILCSSCEGNGAVVCSQCKGEGLNSQDYFGGRFKAGAICWLCRKEMLCGNCNGAGFMGGFLNTQDE